MYCWGSYLKGQKWAIEHTPVQTNRYFKNKETKQNNVWLNFYWAFSSETKLLLIQNTYFNFNTPDTQLLRTWFYTNLVIYTTKMHFWKIQVFILNENLICYLLSLNGKPFYMLVEGTKTKEQGWIQGRDLTFDFKKDRNFYLHYSPVKSRNI